MIKKHLAKICAGLLIPWVAMFQVDAGGIRHAGRDPGPGALRARSLTDGSLALESVISVGSLTQPTCMAFLDVNDILVGQKIDGQVRRIQDETVTGPVLDLDVSAIGEQGLLGMALDPLFATNNLVYLFYTKSATGSDSGVALNNRISRFTWDGNTLGNEQLLVTLPSTPSPNHNGGVIAFGPPTAAPVDRKLFAVMGDMARDNQTENWATGGAPDDTGVIIRINPDGTTPSGTDKGPFLDVAGGNPSLERMFAYGIRNSFGIGFDPVTGALWQTENGWMDWDEINLCEPAFNSGWQDQMGPTGFPEVDEPAPGKVQFSGVGTYADPVFSWRQSVSPTSIHFLTSTALGAGYQFDCFVADHNNGNLYRFEPNGNRDGFALTGGLSNNVMDTTAGDTNADILFGSGFGIITDIETGPGGALHVLSFSFGQIYRIFDPGVIPVGLSEFTLE